MYMHIYTHIHTYFYIFLFFFTLQVIIILKSDEIYVNITLSFTMHRKLNITLRKKKINLHLLLEGKT